MDYWNPYQNRNDGMARDLRFNRCGCSDLSVQRGEKPQTPVSALINLQEAYSNLVFNGHDTLCSEIDDCRMGYQLAPNYSEFGVWRSWM